MTDLACKKPVQCQPPTDDCCTPPSPKFDLCVGSYTLHWDGKRAWIEQRQVIPDGTYDTVTVVGGCIEGFGYAPPPKYTRHTAPLTLLPAKTRQVQVQAL